MISFLPEVIKLREERKKNFLKLWANSYTDGLIYGSFNYDNSFRSLHCSFSWMRSRYLLRSLSNSSQKPINRKRVDKKKNDQLSIRTYAYPPFVVRTDTNTNLKITKKDWGIEKNIKQLSFADYPTCLCIAESRIVFTVF